MLGFKLAGVLSNSCTSRSKKVLSIAKLKEYSVTFFNRTGVPAYYFRLVPLNNLKFMY